MNVARIGTVALAAFVLLLMALPSTGALAPAAAATPASSSPAATASLPAVNPSAIHSAIPAAEQSALADRFEHVAQDAGLPRSAGLMPNLQYATVREGSALVPTNLAGGSVSPGPTSIGVNDLGLRSSGGNQLSAYSYRTTSIDGTVNFTNMSLLPVMTNASDAITVQENAVLNNMTLFGRSIYQVWAQNVIFYSIPNHQLQLLTDGWNFSAGSDFGFTQNDIYANSPGGMLFTGVYVHQVPLAPPAFVVHMPFTIRLYLNATNVDGRNALYFNYTLSSAQNITLAGHSFGKSIMDGSFDWIIFNSTANQTAGYSAPPASFLISGSQPSGVGLANDAEIAICGPSDGYSADIRSLNATAQLLTLDDKTGQYRPVPAAFTTTEDTGESVEGVDAHFTASSAQDGVAYLTNGPEFVYGLWNATAHSIKERPFTVDLSPASTQLWVSPRTPVGYHSGFVNASAAWAIAPGPDVTFWLPTGPGLTYSVAGLANDYTPGYRDISWMYTSHLTLTPNAAEGLYVPVIAFGNAGVASIAQSGAGTWSNPYIISYRQYRPISSLYGTYDEFTEPLYPGVLLSGVTAYTEIEHMPSLEINYTNSDLYFLRYFYGLNVSNINYLPMEVYDSTHVSVVHNSMITGWFPVTLTGFLYASLYLSNDTHALVAYNTFSSMGSSMVIVNPNGNRTQEHNTVFGNTFDVNPIESTPYGAYLYLVRAFMPTFTGGPAVGGLGVFSSGNTIYNNMFLTPITTYSPPQNPYLSYVFVNDLGYHEYAQTSAVYLHNVWDVGLQPSTYSAVVNGILLDGTIEGAAFVGGNAYVNWTGQRPYTDQGLIYTGGDQYPVPLVGSGFYSIVFQETGLPRDPQWTVFVNGTAHSRRGSMIVVYLSAGTYSFRVPNKDGEMATPRSGTFDLTGNTYVDVTFAR
jgi:thermopsin